MWPSGQGACLEIMRSLALLRPRDKLNLIQHGSPCFHFSAPHVTNLFASNQLGFLTVVVVVVGGGGGVYLSRRYYGA